MESIGIESTYKMAKYIIGGPLMSMYVYWIPILHEWDKSSNIEQQPPLGDCNILPQMWGRYITNGNDLIFFFICLKDIL